MAVGCLACSQRRANRVAPGSEAPSPDVYEIRPHRRLRILVLGPALETGRVDYSKRRGIDPRSGIMTNLRITPDGHTSLFFIHGVGGSADIWRAQYEYFLNLGFRVIVPDLIGHGQSDIPHHKSAYHFSEIGLDILAIFDRFHTTTNIVIGHSYGCSFAALLAKKREILVTKLVLISGGDPTPLGPQVNLFMLPVCTLSCFKSWIVKRLLKKAIHKSHDQDVNQDLAFKIPTFVLRHTMRGQDWPEGDEEFHESLLVPTLLVYGADDQLVSIEEEMMMKNCINGSKLVLIEECSHMATLERPECVNRYIHQFLELNDWFFIIGEGEEEAGKTSSSPLRPRPNPFNEIA